MQLWQNRSANFKSGNDLRPGGFSYFVELFFLSHVFTLYLCTKKAVEKKKTTKQPSVTIINGNRYYITSKTDWYFLAVLYRYSSSCRWKEMHTFTSKEVVSLQFRYTELWFGTWVWQTDVKATFEMLSAAQDSQTYGSVLNVQRKWKSFKSFLKCFKRSLIAFNYRSGWGI